MYFEVGQIVSVIDSGHYSFRDQGTVAVINATGGEFVSMRGNIHSSLRRFPENDPRSKWVEFTPDQCELVQPPVTAPPVAVWQPESAPLPQGIHTVNEMVSRDYRMEPVSSSTCAIVKNGEGGIRIVIQCATEKESSRMLYRLLKTIVNDPNSPFASVQVANRPGPIQ